MPLPDVVSGLLLSGRPPVRVWSGVPKGGHLHSRCPSSLFCGSGVPDGRHGESACFVLQLFFPSLSQRRNFSWYAFPRHRPQEHGRWYVVSPPQDRGTHLSPLPLLPSGSGLTDTGISNHFVQQQLALTNRLCTCYRTGFHIVKTPPRPSLSQPGLAAGQEPPRCPPGCRWRGSGSPRGRRPPPG